MSVCLRAMYYKCRGTEACTELETLHIYTQSFLWISTTMASLRHLIPPPNLTKLATNMQLFASQAWNTSHLKHLVLEQDLLSGSKQQYRGAKRGEERKRTSFEEIGRRER